MNYIGSKHRLLPFIKNTIYDVVGRDLKKNVFCDLFAGTGIVGRGFKKEVKSVISNDYEYYSFVLNSNYIGNHQPMQASESFIANLKKTTPQEGFIYINYCKGAHGNRQYFSDENGKLIDGMRVQIENWFQEKTIDDNLYYFLLASLIESADKVANTASVYGAYLKHLKKTAAKKIEFKISNFDYTKDGHQVFNKDSNELITMIEGDILYLDPPYNERQYGANYHLLNTIARYDSFEPRGKTGLRTYKKSEYCSKRTVTKAFENLIENANFKYIFLSYNNEGLMSVDDVKRVMSKYGKYDLASTQYQRFKADKTKNRNHLANSTKEFLHILEKN